MTTQFFSPLIHFKPVSSAVAALMVSVLPLRENSIASPLGVPSNFFEPSLALISISYFSPFFATVSEAPSIPGQTPTSASTFPATTLPSFAGEPVGLAACEGEVVGLAAGTFVPDFAVSAG